MIFAIMPVFALGGLGVPALQVMAGRQMNENQQGQFQGVLASALSLASIIAPLGASICARVRGRGRARCGGWKALLAGETER